MLKSKILIIGGLTLATGVAAAGVVGLPVGQPAELPVRKNATMPTNTRRIWIINNDNWWTDNDYYVYAWNATNNYTSAAVNIVLNSGEGGYFHGLGYCDITMSSATSAISVIVRDGGTDWGSKNQTVTVNLPAFGDEDTIWLNSGLTWNEKELRNDRNASIGTTNGFSAAQLATIMDNYVTCSTANTNGYNAIPQLETNFFAKTDADILSSSEGMTDYNWPAYDGAGKSYEGLPKDTATTLGNKIAKMRAMYAANKD